ncbi:site-specific integrase, partial [Escherichia coli]|uniref:site-specific integrase n=3 Tax=Escherichia coli TaxID=562 RepID=UPI002028F110
KQKKLIMLPSETMIWQPEFTDKTLSRKPGAVHSPGKPGRFKMRIDSKTSWLSACRRAGIEDFRFHDLRHTWASWLIQSGVPLSVLQEMGGWESIEMVRRYAHLAPNHLTEHARKIDDIFGDNVPNMSHSGIMEDIKKA